MDVNLVYDAQALLNLVLGVCALGLEAFALVDALRRSPQAFLVAEKRTKTFWVAVLGVCTVVGFVSLTRVLSFVGLLAVVGAGVYLADVRPEVSRYSGRGRGGSSRPGPYGPW